jgi:hypothetical protein
MTLIYSTESDLVIIHFDNVFRIQFDGTVIHQKKILNYEVLALDKNIESQLITDVSLENKVYNNCLWFYRIDQMRSNI